MAGSTKKSTGKEFWISGKPDHRATYAYWIRPVPSFQVFKNHNRSVFYGGARIAPKLAHPLATEVLPPTLVLRCGGRENSARPDFIFAHARP